MNIGSALAALRPGSEWFFNGDTYEGIGWLDKVQSKPSKEEVEAEIQRQIEEYNFNEYQRNRKAEYPPVEDFLDAIVKGDEAQKQAYIDACLAVKAKYPKPEGV